MFQSLLNFLSSSTGVEPVIGCDQVATWSTMRNLASVSLDMLPVFHARLEHACGGLCRK